MEIRFPRTACIIGSSSSSRFFPLKSTCPLSTFPVMAGRSRRMVRAVVVFPAPVSPTSPKVFPLSIWRLMPLMASTVSRSVL